MLQLQKTISKWREGPRKPTLMQRGLSHPSTTNTIEQLLDDDAEIGKVTISDNETLFL